MIYKIKNKKIIIIHKKYKVIKIYKKKYNKNIKKI